MSTVWLGDYVTYDAATQSEEVLPLLECLRFAVQRVRPVDEYLKGVFGGYGPAGGDPGWSIHWIDRAEDAEYPEDWQRCMASLPADAGGCFEAWTYQPISELDPPCGYYSKEVVHHYVHEVLRNFRDKHPKRADEVNALIKRFGIEDA